MSASDPIIPFAIDDLVMDTTSGHGGPPRRILAMKPGGYTYCSVESGDKRVLFMGWDEARAYRKTSTMKLMRMRKGAKKA